MLFIVSSSCPLFLFCGHGEGKLLGDCRVIPLPEGSPRGLVPCSRVAQQYSRYSGTSLTTGTPSMFWLAAVLLAHPEVSSAGGASAAAHA